MRAKGNVLRAGHRVGLLVSGVRAKVRCKSVVVVVVVVVVVEVSKSVVRPTACLSRYDVSQY